MEPISETKRKKVIAGNWKMNKLPSETATFIESIKPFAENTDCDIIVCVPFLSLAEAVATISGTNIKVGAQNCHWEQSGAFTGEVSASMLRDIGVQYVIVGHSERRQYFGETDTTVNQRLRAALSQGLYPILCVGETLEERELGVTTQVLLRQVTCALNSVSTREMSKVTVAYEPVWAIGTGKTASSEQANEACADIRNCISSLYGAETAENVCIQYGGSMNPKNAAELLAKPDIDGGLIGGASLKAPDFGSLIEIAGKRLVNI